jgi:septation ring formation regulator EzrA
MIEYIAFMGAVLGYPLAWYFGGKRKNDAETKKNDVEVVTAISEMYNTFLVQYKSRMEEMQYEVGCVKDHYKAIQLQFNDMSLAYTREVEVSQNWEKLHKELKEKYDELEKNYDALKKDHDALKKDYQKYKKDMTN